MARGRDATTVVMVERVVRSRSAAATNSWEHSIREKPQAMCGVMLLAASAPLPPTEELPGGSGGAAVPPQELQSG